MATPRLLYRYRSLAPAVRDYVERTFMFNELFFAKPSSFNDPFDCQPTFLFDATDLEILSFYTRVGLKHVPGLPVELAMVNARHKLHNRATGPRSPIAPDSIQKLHTESVSEKIGVLCLSESRDNILMWGHYADNHHGICIGFDSRNAFFKHVHPVNYSAARPTINAFRDTRDQMLDAAIFTKADQWAYESEWRQIRYEAGAGVLVFPPHALAVVILGCKATAETEELVKIWLRLRKSRPRLLRAKPAPSNFALDFRAVGY